MSRKADLSNDEYLKVYGATKEEFPDFRVVFKAGVWWMRWVDVFLKVITFGKMTGFLDTYTTTIGYTIYVGTSWPMQGPYSRAVTLRHEAVHMRQRRMWGIFLYSVIYLFLPLPIGLALGRRNFERKGYEESLRAQAEYYGVKSLRESYTRVRVVEHFTGASYFWMWPFRKSVNRWYDDFVSKVEKEHSGNTDGEAR